MKVATFPKLESDNGLGNVGTAFGGARILIP